MNYLLQMYIFLILLSGFCVVFIILFTFLFYIWTFYFNILRPQGKKIEPLTQLWRLCVPNKQLIVNCVFIQKYLFSSSSFSSALSPQPHTFTACPHWAITICKTVRKSKNVINLTVEISWILKCWLIKIVWNEPQWTNEMNQK